MVNHKFSYFRIKLQLFNPQHQTLEVFPFRMEHTYRMIGRMTHLMHDLHIPSSFEGGRHSHRGKHTA